ncbi:MAG: hypothetical protein A2X36_06850 [Elusimicrobia bacterium GWA2_69_24]|nr:MAG: hypothetical protein A2X36_06850 [Elusimicrobia bacterium GWA2_69_24]HBL15886.1 hypothetical protein [Elusimicrobiota bacterium]
MTRTRRLGSGFPAALLLAVAASAAEAPAPKGLEDHVRESYNIPAMVAVKLGAPEASVVPGFQKIKVTFVHRGMEQVETLFLSSDQKHYVMGGFKDLASTPDDERLKKMDLRGAAVRGKAGAPVSVVEYTDFQCPFCQKGYRIMAQKIMKDYPDKVSWVYKSYPLKGMHPWAEPAAVAVECALLQSQDRFWALHDLIFDNQQEIRLQNFDEKLKELAGAAKVDLKKLEACRKESKTLAKVQRDLAETEALGANGAPAFFVNGHAVNGADYDEIRRLIDESLQGKHGKL